MLWGKENGEGTRIKAFSELSGQWDLTLEQRLGGEGNRRADVGVEAFPGRGQPAPSPEAGTCLACWKTCKEALEEE